MIGNFSAYDFITNFVPGAVFAAIVTLGSRVEITSEDLLLAAALYFFYGVISSRIGSLVVQPLLEKLSFLKKGDYRSFLIAEGKDRKLQSLLEARNFYRTQFTALLLSLPFLILEPKRLPKIDHETLLFLVVTSCVVMLFSLRKQSRFMAERIDFYFNSEKSNEADGS